MPGSPSKNNGSAKSKKKKPKFCHQCHQRTKDFMVWCKNEEGGTCSLLYCRQCLFKRYGEKAEEVALLDDWTCPRCRGICNCCVCRKKQDRKSTDVLIHGDKATGFSSDLEMLQVKGPERVSLEMDLQKTQVASDKGEESFVYESTDSKSNPKPTNSTSVSDDKKTEEGLEAIGDAKKNDDGGQQHRKALGVVWL
ncbi:hypothetical protein TIFTF001_026174 [Ficus carica]|uniref:Zinc-finger domain-containing protein n=1 Tax=Ficus carica TaxID=3494 RepID=A0AA88IXV3_FICCA|nr:hypothetical protein TIFTF001_026174 [Ficus carica]